MRRGGARLLRLARNDKNARHCEERSDEAIPSPDRRSGAAPRAPAQPRHRHRHTGRGGGGLSRRERHSWPEFLGRARPRRGRGGAGRRARRLVRGDGALPPSVRPPDSAHRHHAEEQGPHRRGPGRISSSAISWRRKSSRQNSRRWHRWSMRRTGSRGPSNAALVAGRVAEALPPLHPLARGPRAARFRRALVPPAASRDRAGAGAGPAHRAAHAQRAVRRAVRSRARRGAGDARRQCRPALRDGGRAQPMVDPARHRSPHRRTHHRRHRGAARPSCAGPRATAARASGPRSRAWPTISSRRPPRNGASPR